MPLYAVDMRFPCTLAFCVALGCLFAPRAAAQVQPAPGTCLGGNCTVGAPVLQGPRQDVGARPAGPGFARGAAWFGVFSAALTLGGATAIAVLDDVPSERVTRGVWLGYTALSVPLVAIGSYTTRKRAKFEGLRGVRLVGWTAYAGVVTNGVVQWYGAFQNFEQPAWLTIGVGALSALALLPHAFEAYVCGRHARQKGLVRVEPGGSGIRVRF